MTSQEILSHNKKCWVFKKTDNDLNLEAIDLDPQPLPTAITQFWDAYQKELDASWLSIFTKYQSVLQRHGNETAKEYIKYNDFLDSSLSLLSDRLTRHQFGSVIINKIEPSSSTPGCTEVNTTLPESSLLNCLRYSPAKLRSDPTAILYALYQVVYYITEYHTQGIPHGALTLDNIFIEEDLTIRLGLPNFDAISEMANKTSRVGVPRTSSSNDVTPPADSSRLADMVQGWVQGRVSNLDYLMFLNKLAGRSMNDPNHHPMLPWVTDFSAKNGGLRDLSKSKFRLNKGDSHLDQLFQHPLLDAEAQFASPISSQLGQSCTPLNAATWTGKCAVMSNRSAGYAPHHVSDAMCDITYYSYKARQTPIDVLCRFVRPQWRPQEYPYSMERMYNWTPDECIPEFYTDPNIFVSIHEEMKDLQLPEWCSDPDDFLRYHRGLLESETVSQALHHWIDITFGYKLSGNDAINAKNVHLQMVDGHTNLRSFGVVSLFSTPHPRRCPTVSDVYFGPIRPLLPRTLFEKLSTTSGEALNNSILHLPQDYNPLELIKQFEELYTFIRETCRCEPPALPDPPKVDIPVLQRLLREDILALGCLITELYLFNEVSPEQHFLPTCPERVGVAREVCQQHWVKLPNSVTLGLEVILRPQDPKSSHYVTDEFRFLPTPGHLLHALLSFPPYMHSLHNLIRQLGVLSSPDCTQPDTATVRVKIVAEFIYHQGANMPREALAILTPHVVQLMTSKDTDVQAAIHLFSPYACLVGRQVTCHALLPALVSICSSDSGLCRPYLFRIYEHRFLGQVLLHTGLRHFLAHLPHLLIEAVSGYKDCMLQGSASSSSEDSNSLESDEIGEEDEKVGTSSPRLQQKSKDIIRSGDPSNLISPRLSSSSWEEDLRREIQSSRESQQRDTEPPTRLSTPDLLEDDIAEDIMNNVNDGDVSSSTREDEVESPVVMRTWNSRRGAHHPRNNDPFSQVDDAEQYDTEGEDEEGRLVAAEDSLVTRGSCVVDQMSSRAKRVPVKKRSESLHESGSYGGSAPCSSTNLLNSNHPPTAITGNTASVAAAPTKPYYTPKSSRRLSRRGEENHYPGSSQLSETGNTQSHIRPINPLSGGQDTFDLNLDKSASISQVANDSVVWLAEKLGPVITAQYLSRNLLRMLVLCYSTSNHLEPTSTTSAIPQPSSPLPMPVNTSKKVLLGDHYAAQPLLCLKRIACLYGMPFMLGQYLPFIKDCIEAAQKELTAGKVEGGLVASLVLLQQMVTYLPDTHLMDNLQEPILQEIVTGGIQLASSLNVIFPSGAIGRRAVLYKLIDTIYVLGLRLGFESTRSHMTLVFQRFFASFGRVYASPSSTGIERAESVENARTASAQRNSLNPSDRVGDCPESRISELGTKEKRTSTNSSTGLMDDSLREYYLIHVSPDSQEVTIDTVSPRNTHGGVSDVPFEGFPVVSNGGKSSSVSDLLRQEMKDTFTSEMAHLAYIPCCRLAGGIHMDTHLFNADLIHNLVSDHEQSQTAALSTPTPFAPQSTASPAHRRVPSSPSHTTATSNSQVGTSNGGNTCAGTSLQMGGGASGNSISIGRARLVASAEQESALVRCQDLEKDKRQRHLTGSWASYWSHELGISDRNKSLDIKQMKLSTLTGHLGVVRSLSVLDTENSLISCGKDKTVRLWSLSSAGQSDTTTSHRARFIYQQHRKAVFAAHFLEPLRMVASCDGSLHLWDPFEGRLIHAMDTSASRSPLTVLARLPLPNCTLVAGDLDNFLHVVDPRSGSLVHKMASGAGVGGASVTLAGGAVSGGSGATAHGGSLRHVAPSPSGNTLICAFTGGFLTAIDRRTGCVVHTWRGHTDDILQVKFYSHDWFITTALDQTVTLWNMPSFASVQLNAHQNETVHCLDLYRHEIVMATMSNRLAVYRDQGLYASWGKLSINLVRGLITSFAVLPMNRLLATASDNGNIVIFC